MCIARGPGSFGSHNSGVRLQDRMQNIIGSENGLKQGSFRNGLSANLAEAFQNIMRHCDVLALGETVHTSDGYYESKISILKNLIENKLLSCVAFENPWSDSKKMSEFVDGGEIDIHSAAAGLLNVWQSTKIIDFLIWLRNENFPRPINERVVFFGFDIQRAEYSGDCVRKFALTHLSKEKAALLDPSSGSLLVRLNDKGLLPTWLAVKELLTTGHTEIEQALDELVEIIAEVESIRVNEALDDFDLKLSCIALSYYLRFTFHFAVEAHRTGVSAPSTKQPMPTRGFELRDEGMSALFEAYRNQLEFQKVAVWAHNLHIIKNGDKIPSWNKKCLGSHFADRYAERFYSVAIVGYDVKINWPWVPGMTGPPIPHPENSVEHLLKINEIDQCFIDLRESNLFQSHAGPYRINPILEVEDLRSHFDGLIYLNESIGMTIFDPAATVG